jgi:hypothetical protein
MSNLVFDFASWSLESDQTAVQIAGKETRAAPCFDVKSGDQFGRYWFVIKRSILYIIVQ